MDAWIFEIMKTFKGMEGGLPKTLWLQCILANQPKPYTKSTLTNKSQAKRKKQINTYLNRNKDVVDGSPLHKQSTNGNGKIVFSLVLSLEIV